MSWECYTKRKCGECGNEYDVEESTLVIAMNDYDLCPKCGGKGDVMSTSSITDSINETIEKFKNRKKRNIVQLGCNGILGCMAMDCKTCGELSKQIREEIKEETN